MQEEVEDIQVEVDGGMDVLLGCDSLHDQPRVKDDEQREEHGASHCDAKVYQGTLQEELTTTTAHISDPYN